MSPHGRLFTSFRVSRAAWRQIVADAADWFAISRRSEAFCLSGGMCRA